MRPLEILTRLVSRVVDAWHRWRGRRQEPTRRTTDTEDPLAVAVQIIDDAYQALAPYYDTAPHPTA